MPSKHGEIQSEGIIPLKEARSKTPRSPKTIPRSRQLAAQRLKNVRRNRGGGKPRSTHNKFTHSPIEPTCKNCLAARMQKTSRCARTDSNMRCDALLPAVVFGDRITADHAIMNEEENKSAEDEALCACV